MIDENENTLNLQNYPPIVNVLQCWTGSGKLSWRNNSVDGDFVLSRLLNGRLRFIFKPQDWRKSTRFSELKNLKFEGVAEDESVISVTGIHFTRRYLDEMPWDIYVGFAQSASRRIDAEANTVSIQCDLTNYSMNQRTGPVELQLDAFTISISRLGWGKKDSGIEEHAIAYQHASLSSCLKIASIPLSKTAQAIDCLREVATLLSIACRGHVSIAARHIWNQEERKLDSLFEEPPFSDRKWGRPLIPSEFIEEFLLSMYPVNRNQVQKLALVHVTDHYLQALTLRSAWPLSVGIFTAMESLKTAIFRLNMNEENETYNYWVVPPEDFESNKDMIEDVIAVLANHFSRFSTLTPSEEQSLEAQIKHGLKNNTFAIYGARTCTLTG